MVKEFLTFKDSIDLDELIQKIILVNSLRQSKKLSKTEKELSNTELVCVKMGIDPNKLTVLQTQNLATLVSQIKSGKKNQGFVTHCKETAMWLNTKIIQNEEDYEIVEFKTNSKNKWRDYLNTEEVGNDTRKEIASLAEKAKFIEEGFVTKPNKAYKELEAYSYKYKIIPTEIYRKRRELQLKDAIFQTKSIIDAVEACYDYLAQYRDLDDVIFEALSSTIKYKTKDAIKGNNAANSLKEYETILEESAQTFASDNEEDIAEYQKLVEIAKDAVKTVYVNAEKENKIKQLKQDCAAFNNETVQSTIETIVDNAKYNKEKDKRQETFLFKDKNGEQRTLSYYLLNRGGFALRNKAENRYFETDVLRYLSQFYTNVEELAELANQIEEIRKS